MMNRAVMSHVLRGYEPSHLVWRFQRSFGNIFAILVLTISCLFCSVAAITTSSIQKRKETTFRDTAASFVVSSSTEQFGVLHVIR